VFSSGGNVVVASAAGGSAATATGSSVRIEVLRLLAKILDNHSLGSVRQYFKSLVPALCAAVNETGYKVSFEAFGTVSSLVRLLTCVGAPPYPQHIQALYGVVASKVQNADSDLEVRERAIITLSVLLGRTSNTVNLSHDSRHNALEILLERLRNETTRSSAARAIEGIAKSTNSANDMDSRWVHGVVIELGSQLRKANRALRAVSLEALKSIATNNNCLSKMDAESKKELVAVLTPLLVVGDMQLLALAICVMRMMMSEPRDGVGATADVIAGICGLVKSPLGSGLVLENLLNLVGMIGETDQTGKQELMKSLLRNVGVGGETGVVAKVVAQLLVSGGGERGGFVVGIKDFVEEVEGQKDEKRKCLALMVLGEIGLRMGNKFPVEPTIFLKQFSDGGDNVPLAAAVALGLVGAGNVDKHVPVVMKQLAAGKDGYLLVHSLKEIITHSSANGLASYTSDMWNTLLSPTVANDDSKAVAAECVGRLTIMDPYSFLPELQTHMTSNEPVIRGLVISALRYTFTDTDTSYDKLLRPIVVDFLDSMLRDAELENRRLALTALNSAATNKAHLLAGAGLDRLLPRVYAESVIKPELVREIQMGPFRHRVDGGLEVRKSAYETLYSLLETAFRNLDMQVYFDRVIAGISDEHDIRALANLMLAKLAVLTKDETIKRLGAIADVMKRVLMEKPKDNAVKQELERHTDGVRGIVKVAVVIQREVAASVDVQRWEGFWDWLMSGYKEVLSDVTGDEGV